MMIIFLLYLHLFAISLKFLPIGTRTIFSILGIFVLIKKKGNTKGLLKLFENKSFKYLFIWVVVSSISTIINSYYDFYCISYLVSYMNEVFSSFFIAYILYSKYKVNSLNYLEYIVYTIFIFCILSLVMFFNPSIRSILFDILKTNELQSDFMYATVGQRLLGFGSMFFGAGVISGLALIIIIFLLKSGNIYYKLKMLIMLISIFFIGMMSARTTIIGAIFGIILLSILWRNYYRGTNIKTLILFLVLIFLAINLFNTFLNSYRFDTLIKFAFEMTSNYEYNDTLGTSSTKNLMEMIIFPNNFITYIIGDGAFANPIDKELFYKNIDIGYLRLLYYSGLISMISFYLFQYYLFKFGLEQTSKDYSKLVYIIFLYLMVVNFKGIIDLNSFILPFIFIGYFDKHKYDNNHYNPINAN